MNPQKRAVSLLLVDSWTLVFTMELDCWIVAHLVVSMHMRYVSC